MVPSQLKRPHVCHMGRSPAEEGVSLLKKVLWLNRISLLVPTLPHPQDVFFFERLNPRGAWVSSHLPLASPVSDFRANRWSEECGATMENSQRRDSNAVLEFSLEGQISSRSQVVVVVVDPSGCRHLSDVAWRLWRALKASVSAATTSPRRISSVVGRMLPTAGSRRQTPINPGQVIRMCLGMSASSPHRGHLAASHSVLRHCWQLIEGLRPISWRNCAEPLQRPVLICTMGRMASKMPT